MATNPHNQPAPIGIAASRSFEPVLTHLRRLPCYYMSFYISHITVFIVFFNFTVVNETLLATETNPHNQVAIGRIFEPVATPHHRRLPLLYYIIHLFSSLFYSRQRGDIPRSDQPAHSVSGWIITSRKFEPMIQQPFPYRPLSSHIHVALKATHRIYLYLFSLQSPTRHST